MGTAIFSLPPKEAYLLQIIDAHGGRGEGDW